MIAIIRALGTLKIEFGHSDRAVSSFVSCFLHVKIKGIWLSYSCKTQDGQRYSTQVIAMCPVSVV